MECSHVSIPVTGDIFYCPCSASCPPYILYEEWFKLQLCLIFPYYHHQCHPVPVVYKSLLSLLAHLSLLSPAPALALPAHVFFCMLHPPPKYTQTLLPGCCSWCSVHPESFLSVPLSPLPLFLDIDDNSLHFVNDYFITLTSFPTSSTKAVALSVSLYCVIFNICQHLPNNRCFIKQQQM